MDFLFLNIEQQKKTFPFKLSSAANPDKLVSKAICPETHLTTMFWFTVWPGWKRNKESRNKEDEICKIINKQV